MGSERYLSSTSGGNLSSLLGLLNDPKTVRVVLFASPIEEDETYSREDGPTTNLPLVAALVEHKLEGVPTQNIVFDGNFLTAARNPRYSEVRDLLDAAVSSGKTFFSTQRAPFTSALSPDDAVKKLQAMISLQPLTSDNRKRYFSMLSALTEAEFAAQ